MKNLLKNYWSFLVWHRYNGEQFSSPLLDMFSFIAFLCIVAPFIVLSFWTCIKFATCFLLFFLTGFFTSARFDNSTGISFQLGISYPLIVVGFIFYVILHFFVEMIYTFGSFMVNIHDSFRPKKKEEFIEQRIEIEAVEKFPSLFEEWDEEFKKEQKVK